ncbi:hypothetical protein QR680_001504 [Steinernema hermaphroditum]|uniref:Uncharacterized protein n=1 Tax=Steinernema hermaphroditum TaxID=289476 RepID=A0AA39H0J9_9BILA|nr:hypothetical protein QR680_001504 [Steinernema hermaphroditum]
MSSATMHRYSMADLRNEYAAMSQQQKRASEFYYVPPLISDVDSEFDEEEAQSLSCTGIPCCVSEDQCEDFGHHVSIFMVALVAFATFFCVTLILILVFVLG